MDPLLFYSNLEIQKRIVEFSKNREVAFRYGENFGKRPDILQYENDLLEMVKNGMTSYHVSEERWEDPLHLRPGMSKGELDSLRKGWDLIIDIDTPYWDYAKITAFLVIEALKFHDIENIGVKFSGNKGWHILVPFEGFPEKVNNQKIKDLFPEAPRFIAGYLNEMIKNHLAESILEKSSVEDLLEKTGMKKEDLFPNNKLDPFKLVGIDTLLISSRHMIRGLYSLHEKSGLVSVPVDPKRILEFEKGEAKPENIKLDARFVPIGAKNEAKTLMVQALDWGLKKERYGKEGFNKKEYEDIKIAIKDENLFPPCIKKILEGLKEDGRKRAVFVLINFFSSLGWSYEDIEKRLFEWNKKNYEELREGYIKSQVIWSKRQGKKMLPPNCSNDSYYKSMGVCCSEFICSKVKNPVNYALMKVRNSKRDKEDQ